MWRWSVTGERVSYLPGSPPGHWSGRVSGLGSDVSTHQWRSRGKIQGSLLQHMLLSLLPGRLQCPKHITEGLLWALPQPGPWTQEVHTEPFFSSSSPSLLAGTNGELEKGSSWWRRAMLFCPHRVQLVFFGQTWSMSEWNLIFKSSHSLYAAPFLLN